MTMRKEVKCLRFQRIEIKLRLCAYLALQWSALLFFKSCFLFCCMESTTGLCHSGCWRSRTRKTRDALKETCLKGILNWLWRWKQSRLLFWNAWNRNCCIFANSSRNTVFKDWYDAAIKTRYNQIQAVKWFQDLAHWPNLSAKKNKSRKEKQYDGI